MTNPLRILRFFVLALVGLTLPFEYSKVTLAGYPLTPNKAVAAILLGYVALAWAVERWPAPRDPKRGWILFFGVVSAIGAVQSYLFGMPIEKVFAVAATQSTLILFYLAVTYAVRERRDLDNLLLSFAIGCVIATVSGWLGLGRQVETTRYGERLAGEGANPNLLAFNLILAVPVAASFLFTTERRWMKPFYLGAMAAMTMGVLATLSRTALVSLPAMAVAWAIRFRRVNFLRFSLPVLALAVLAMTFTPERVVKRLHEFTAAESLEDLDPSARTRFVMIPSVLAAFASNPLSGVGLDGYRLWADLRGERGAAIHNAFLQVLAEQGLLGFVPFMLVYGLTWREFGVAFRTSHRLRAHKDRELLGLGLRAALLQVAMAGTTVMGLGQPSNRHKGQWLLFALSTCVLVLVRKRARVLASAAEEAGPAAEALPALGHGYWVPGSAR